MCRDFRKVVTNILGDVKWKPPSFDAENLDIWNYTVLFTKVVLASSEKIQKKKKGTLSIWTRIFFTRNTKISNVLLLTSLFSFITKFFYFLHYRHFSKVFRDLPLCPLEQLLVIKLFFSWNSHPNLPSGIITKSDWHPPWYQELPSNAMMQWMIFQCIFYT